MDTTLLQLEATYFRTALLLGLVRGEAVHRWAEDAIARGSRPAAALIEVVSTPVDNLTALRNALFPLVIDPEPPDVLKSMVGRLHADFAAGRRGLADTVTVLRQMRSLLRLPRDVYDELNAILVRHTQDPAAIPEWLRRYEGRSLDERQE